MVLINNHPAISLQIMTLLKFNNESLTLTTDDMHGENATSMGAPRVPLNPIRKKPETPESAEWGWVALFCLVLLGCIFLLLYSHIKTRVRWSS